MSINIRNYVSDDHIESISEIAKGQAKIIQALSLDNSQKDKEIERLNELVKELREERDYLFNKTTTESNYEIERLHSIIKEVREYVNVELLSSNADYYRKNGGYVSGSDLDVDCIFPILDILDKENK